MNDPLYRKALLRLAADATGAGGLPDPDVTASRANPACGDHVTMQAMLADGRITAVGHHTKACILTQASAALLAGHAMGLDRRGVFVLRAQVAAMLKGAFAPMPPFEAYGEFEGAAQHHGRHICVLLPIDALLAALETGEPGGAGTQA